MDFLHSLVSLLAGVLGWTPDQIVVVVFGAASAPVTVFVTNYLKALFARNTWFPGELADKVSGTVMVILSAVIAVVVVLLVGLLFGVNYFSDDGSLFNGVIGGLAVNQTIAQWIFHKIKAAGAKSNV